MLQALRSSLQRPLDLDAVMPPPDETAVINAIEARPVPWRAAWRLTKLILAQAAKDGCSVVCLCCDEQAESFSLRYCFCREGRDVWYDMVAPPNDVAGQMIALMRNRCGLGRGRERGSFCYRYHGGVHRADCVSADRRTLEVHFGRSQVSG
jgi:hypothetical protein